MSHTPGPTSDELLALYRADLVSFIERSFLELNPETKFLHSLYIDLVASKLEECRNGRIKRLVITLPPRGLKSHMVSVAFAAFLLGHDPAKQIICASYGQDLAEKHARDCRNLMMSAFYRSVFPGTVIAAERQAVNDFMTTRRGGRMSTSVGGVLTGRGANAIILDDVIKPDEAMSETRRKAAIDWYFNSLVTRLNNKEEDVIILLMQRLHQQDLVGELLDREPERWEVLSLPAIAREDESYTIGNAFGRSTFERRAGEALHPERESLATLHQIRQSIGEFNFQSQYQQDPIPLEGNLIKSSWLCYYRPEELPRRFSYILQSWDTANKSGEFNDYSVCTTWGLFNRRYYLLDVYRRKVAYPELKRAALEGARRFTPTRILIEDKSSGTPLIQDLRDDGVRNVEAHKSLPGADKLMRLSAQSLKFEQESVLLPRKAAWLDEYVREITGFPGTKHDDQVDSTTQALEFLGDKGRRFASWSGLSTAT
jgi:predicted phage terminase large subunit-like protein